MRTETFKRPGGTTWIVSADVHEVPDLGRLPASNERNQEKRQKLMAKYTGQRSDDDYYGDVPAFYLGDLKHMDEVEKRFNEGWKEGAEKALKLADGLVDKVTQPLSIRRRVRYSDDGDEFDKERLIDGHLDQAWRTTSRQLAVATPIINIACAWGGNSNRSHEQLFWSGAAAIALIRVLEAAGYQTSLTSVCTNDLHAEDKAMVIACNVKKAGEYLRADAVASTICFAPTYRVYLFLAWLASPYVVPSGLGHHCEVRHLLPHAIDSGLIERPQIVIPDAFNEAGAKQAVNDALAELQAANLAALPEGLVRSAR